MSLTRRKFLTRAAQALALVAVPLAVDTKFAHAAELRCSPGPATMAVPDYLNGGLLNPEQANRFIRKLIAEPTIIRGDARMVTMAAPTRDLSKIKFNRRLTNGVA